MGEERRNYSRRRTETAASVETVTGQVLDRDATALNLSVNGARLRSTADMAEGANYHLRLEGTDRPLEIHVLQREDAEYRCRFETPWEELYDVIRQNDDLTLLVLGASDDQP